MTSLVWHNVSGGNFFGGLKFTFSTVIGQFQTKSVLLKRKFKIQAKLWIHSDLQRYHAGAFFALNAVVNICCFVQLQCLRAAADDSWCQWVFFFFFFAAVICTCHTGFCVAGIWCLRKMKNLRWKVNILYCAHIEFIVTDWKSKNPRTSNQFWKFWRMCMRWS